MPGPGSIRVIGGKWRGRRISVADAGALRPTPSRLRETLFNWWRDEVAGAKVLDLFAGSGALGFEAASRGAACVVMVERKPSLCRHLRLQVEALDAAGRIEVHASDVLQWLRREPVGRFDLICMDPPFSSSGTVSRCCELLLGGGWLRQGAMVYAESPSPMEPAEGFTMLRSSRAGRVHGLMWRHAAAAAAS